MKKRVLYLLVLALLLGLLALPLWQGHAWRPHLFFGLMGLAAWALARINKGSQPAKGWPRLLYWLALWCCLCGTLAAVAVAISLPIIHTMG